MKEIDFERSTKCSEKRKERKHLKMCVEIIVFMLDWILLAMQWLVVD